MSLGGFMGAWTSVQELTGSSGGGGSSYSHGNVFEFKKFKHWLNFKRLTPSRVEMMSESLNIFQRGKFLKSYYYFFDTDNLERARRYDEAGKEDLKLQYMIYKFEKYYYKICEKIDTRDF